MAPGEQGCVDQTDRCLTVHGTSTNRTGVERFITVAQQSAAKEDLITPKNQKGCCRCCRQKHVASPGQLFPDRFVQIRIQLQTLFTAEWPWFRLGWICPGPQHSHQHQSNRGHPAEDFSPFQFRSDRFSQAGIEQRQCQQHQCTAENNACGSGHQDTLDWQNRNILLKCGGDA